MFIMHIALQGCLRAHNVPYGLTPDTGGHIKYLLELVEAAESRHSTLIQHLIVRRFADAKLGAHYDAASEQITTRSEIIRLAGATSDYVAKEDLRFELPVLADNLEQHILGLVAPPDVIHAHYADAGRLALEMKRRLGIPFIFTAHSLGRVKSRTLDREAIPSVLTERIATEEAVIAGADRIVASSLDEAELQYGLYQSSRPEIIRVNPPGCNLDALTQGKAMSEATVAQRDKFLTDPAKPAILALARPVQKKNLSGLLHAYGKNPALQDAANLVMYAGTRCSLKDEDVEARGVFRELFDLVDYYDLWGKVALPKTHDQEDVAAIYQNVQAGGGIFANLALNEPFGLTFLEAAAAGLPVVATNRGGPNDIVERCQNGTLVNPTDPIRCGDAMLHLLTDKDAWKTASESGLRMCQVYSWESHAKEYLADVEWISQTRAPVTSQHEMRNANRLLVCDIDNTLTGDRPALQKLRDWLTLNPKTAFGIATGRSLQSAIDIIRQWDIPTPRFLITSVGSEIYWVNDPKFRELMRDNGWPPLGRNDWDPTGIETVLSRFDWLTPQAPREQREFKRSYFLDKIARCADVRMALERSEHAFELIYSHGRFLDLLPKGVSKGHAIHFVAQQLDIDPSQIWAAGDSGNDVHMLEMVGHPIIVGNHTSELSHLRNRPASYFAKKSFAAGVLEGLVHTQGQEHLREV